MQLEIEVTQNTVNYVKPSGVTEVCHITDEKVIEPPPPPAPHPHRGGSTGNSSVVENGSSSSTPIQMPTTAVSPSRVLGHLHSPQYTPGMILTIT